MIETAARAVRAALDEAREGLVEREVLLELVALGAVAGEHVLVIGPPGTAKSEAARRAARAFDARVFEYLLGRFTEPSELFGPIDLRRLREGVVEADVTGMLPEAEIAFLDEVFLGSTAILNTLLALLNERTYRRGHTQLRVPLRVCVAASNALPEDDSLAAFADRFLLRLFVAPVPDASLEALLEAGDRLAAHVAPRHAATLAALDALTAAAREVELAPVRTSLAHAIRLLRKAGVALSDRRAVKTQRLVAAAAALEGRSAATTADLWPIVYALPTEEAQELARSVLADVLAEARNAALSAAALDASSSSAARAIRLEGDARALLEVVPTEEPALARWQLRAEGVLREIDASLPPERVTEALASLRRELAARVA
ncbi:MAG: AAA family ATPase [Myxococcota bacterium]|nr:AAA family ATPase [Myxococcota bacterium]